MTIEPTAVPNLTSALATPLPRVLRPRRARPGDSFRPTRAEVNLANLRHNLRVVQRAAGSAKVWSVLKADGYGHGSKAVARTLERAGTSGVCVALLEEAIELREAGIKVPILVMGGFYGRAHGELLRHDLIPVLIDAGQVEAFAEEVRYAGSEPLQVHLKVDTGMSRLGTLPSDTVALAGALANRPELRLTGLMTHLACADTSNSESITRQLRLFHQANAELKKLGLEPTMLHAANSAATLQYPAARLDMVRPGVALFGVEPSPGASPELRPVMTVRTEVVAQRQVQKGQSVGYGWTWTAKRPSTIATIPMGYADGLSRALSNAGEVLIRGRRAPVVGVVSMDMTMVDVTDIEGAGVGDECVVLGRQKGLLGEEMISVQEIAEHMGSIPWEVLTHISRRVPRFYREPT